MSIKLIVRYDKVLILILYNPPHLRGQGHVKNTLFLLIHKLLPVLLTWWPIALKFLHKIPKYVKDIASLLPRRPDYFFCNLGDCYLLKMSSKLYCYVLLGNDLSIAWYALPSNYTLLVDYVELKEQLMSLSELIWTIPHTHNPVWIPFGVKTTICI